LEDPKPGMWEVKLEAIVAMVCWKVAFSFV
jgi:hypothetical protein